MNRAALDAMVGKPWRFNAHGPEAFDCWGATLTGAREIFGLDLPDLPQCLRHLTDADRAARAALASGHWQRCPPEPGAVMAFCDYHGRVTHAGLCLSPVEVLTASRELGVHVAPLWIVQAVEPRWEAYRWRA
jgi:cell wall-associated NlpC family hydrolase